MQSVCDERLYQLGYYEAIPIQNKYAQNISVIFYNQ